MKEIDIGVEERMSQEEAMQPHQQLKQLLGKSIGIESRLGEKKHTNWSVLVTNEVVFYLPQDALSDPDILQVMEDFSPTVASPPDSGVDGSVQKNSLVSVFTDDPQGEREALRNATSMTFSLTPRTHEPSRLEQGIQAMYTECTKGLDTLRMDPAGAHDLLSSGDIAVAREPLELAVSDVQLGALIAELHSDLQGTWGVASVIENRQGQHPKILDSLQALKENINFANPIHRSTFQLLAFHYLVTEPYFNQGPGQGKHPVDAL